MFVYARAFRARAARNARTQLILACAFAVFGVPIIANAAFQRRVDPEVGAELAKPHVVGAEVRINRVPLVDGIPAALQLERFDIYAPGAVIVAYGEDGQPQRMKVPALQFYRGSVVGHADSWVAITVGDHAIRGFISIKDRRFLLRSQTIVDRSNMTKREELFVDEFAVTDEMPVDGSPGFECAVEQAKISPYRSPLPEKTGDAIFKTSDGALATGTARWVLNIAVDTDYQLYQRLGGVGGAATVNNYVADLVAKASVIYLRDLKTELRIVYQSAYTTATDPFTIVPDASGSPSSTDALAQLGQVWHNAVLPDPRAGLKRSAAVLVSGKTFATAPGSASGVAFVDRLCTSDVPYATANVPGGYAGTYATFNRAADASTVPDPNANPNYRSATSPFDSNYWTLLAFAHELGHVVFSPHTHCVGLTAADKLMYGVTRNYVDECYSGEGGCYSNGVSGAVDANVPPELGTIMSYCHLTSNRGMNTRFTFGQPAEPSNEMVIAMQSRLQGITPTMSAITAPPSMSGGASASASITPVAGSTYAWTITNGAINSGQGTNAINFTATTNPVTIKVTETNSAGCSAVTDTATVTVSSVTFNPPAGLNAHAASSTTALVSWTAPGTGTAPARYNVYRSGDGVNYGLAGFATAPTTNFTDTVSTNKAYLYKVRSADAGGANESADSNVDLATIVVYTNASLTAMSSIIRAVDVNELRTAVEAVRTLKGLAAGTYTYLPSVATTTLVHAADINQLRSNLAAALTGLGFASPMYTNNTITAGVSLINAADFTELRNAMY